MSNIKARINQQNQIVASKVEVNTAGINLADLTDVNITTPSDGSYIIYDSGTNTFLDDQTIVKTATGISLTGTLSVTQDIDVDGTLEADAITVNGITLSETIADTVGAMVTTSNSESGISVTYEDDDNTLDFDVEDFTITLTGDVTGEGTVTNLTNVSFSTTIEPNSVVLGTDTTGNYVSAIAASTGIDSTGTWFGEGIVHALSVDLNELVTETSIEQADFVTMVDATDNGSGKITFSHLEDTIFGNVAGDIAIAAGGEATIQPNSVENSMLAGSITNDKLSNSTVSYGGVQLSLGGNDDTPAFDLQDATNLPATRLTGTIDDARIPSTITRDTELTAHTSLTNNPHSVTSTQLGLGNVTNESKATMFTNPTFTGTVTIPAISGSDGNNEAANKKYVDDSVAGIVDTAPDALNTLNELATALGNDENFATTTATSLGEKLVKSSNLSDLANAATARSNLGLGNVENKSSATIRGEIEDADIPSGIARDTEVTSSLAAFTGSSNVVTVGTIATGVWQGTAIADTYISSATAWNAKEDALTFGIANSNAVKIDSAEVADDEYARFTTNGLEGRTYAEVLSDIGAQADLSTSSVATLSIDDKIQHTGDTNTHITFADDRITLTAGGVEMIDIVQNDSSDDIITIGDPADGEFQFNVSTGDFHADGNITGFSNTTNSDINLKKNITPIEDALTKISQLNGVNFQWKKDDRESMGFIAQNVQEVIPELVHSRSHNDCETLSVEYGNITALLVEGMKQQSEFIEKLESRIKTLEDKLNNGEM